MLTDAANPTFVTATTLTTDEDYKFYVVAVNAVPDQSDPSAVSDPIKAATAPSAPLNLAKKDSDETSITVQWDAPADDGGSAITSYNIYSNGGDPSSTYALIGSTVDTVTEFTHTGLTTESIYRYYVKALNAI